MLLKFDLRRFYHQSGGLVLGFEPILYLATKKNNMDPSLLMDGLDLGFDDIVDEIEEDICIEDDFDLDEEDDIAFVRCEIEIDLISKPNPAWAIPPTLHTLYSRGSNGGDSGEDDIFDAIVGQLEEIVMGEFPLSHGWFAFLTNPNQTLSHFIDDEFMDETDTFMKTNCLHFERGEEMKLEYTTLFQQYVSKAGTHPAPPNHSDT